MGCSGAAGIVVGTLAAAGGGIGGCLIGIGVGGSSAGAMLWFVVGGADFGPIGGPMGV